MGFVLKLKLKSLKETIRERNRMEYGNVERHLALLRDEIEELDGKCDIGL